MDQLSEWPLWEVFVRGRSGLSHVHVGSLHAVDAEMALDSARDVYTRRGEASSVWVVRSSHVHASDPAAKEENFAPAREHPYRHASHYAIPDDVRNI